SDDVTREGRNVDHAKNRRSIRGGTASAPAGFGLQVVPGLPFRVKSRLHCPPKALDIKAQGHAAQLGYTLVHRVRGLLKASASATWGGSAPRKPAESGRGTAATSRRSTPPGFPAAWVGSPTASFQRTSAGRCCARAWSSRLSRSCKISRIRKSRA